MPLCHAILNCDYSTCYRHGGDIISVGVTFHEEERFYLVCLRDTLMGCQHLVTKNDGVVVVMERIARAWRESVSPGA